MVVASLEQMQNSDKTGEVASWLQAADPSVNYNRAVRAHHPGTGEWLLRSTQFRKWKEQSNSFLWLHGLSGSGKTILSATIIHHLGNEHSSSALYFYFDFSDRKKQQFEDMLRSLLLQLYHGSSLARTTIDALVDSCRHGTEQPSLKQLGDTLQTVLEKSVDTRIILDALDEGQSPSELVQWCRAMYNSETIKVRLFITSRTQVLVWPNEEQIISVGLESVKGDINLYTRRRLYSGEFAHWENQPMLKDEVATTISGKAGGM
jgi:hypothetical protein